MKGSMAGLLTHMLSRPVVGNAIKVSLFVGTCLNAINQGAAIWHGTGVEWSKVVLNYVVPYLVASYSAAKARKGLEG
jgi:hypothetical protein